MSELAEARAFLFGLAIGASVGPVALYVMQAGLEYGRRKALECALGVAVADFTYAVVALAVGARLERWLSAHQAQFQAASGGVLAVLGVWLLWHAIVRPAARPAQPHSEPMTGFALTYMLTLANPLTILLFVSFSGQLPLTRSWEDAPYYATLIFLGSLPAQVSYALVGAGMQKVLSPRAVRLASIFSAAGIVLFGLYGVARS
jgi:threonine/homoserine/homoserine lactone efflux protein